MNSDYFKCPVCHKNIPNTDAKSKKIRTSYEENTKYVGRTQHITSWYTTYNIKCCKSCYNKFFWKKAIALFLYYTIPAGIFVLQAIIRTAHVREWSTYFWMFIIADFFLLLIYRPVVKRLYLDFKSYKRNRKIIESAKEYNCLLRN